MFEAGMDDLRARGGAIDGIDGIDQARRGETSPRIFDGSDKDVDGRAGRAVHRCRDPALCVLVLRGP